MKLAAVTLDATGTLFHSPRRAEIYSEVLARHGVFLAPETAARLIPVVWQEFACIAPSGADRFARDGGTARDFWHRFVSRCAALAEAAAPSRFASAELFERFAAPEAWEVFPDARPALAALRERGLAIAIVANWDERLPRLLEGLGIAARVDAVVCSAEVGREKPHPAIFRAALARLGVEARAALHVGDSRRDDVEGAEAAGMRALLLTRGGGGDLATLGALVERIDREARPRAVAAAPAPR